MRLVLLLFLLGFCSAEGRAKLDPTSFSRFTPIKFGTTQLTIVTEKSEKQIIERLTVMLKAVDADWSYKLGRLPRKNITLVLLSKDSYLHETGAPVWSNAIYQDNKIYIPIDDLSIESIDNIERTVRHEYTHAIISSLSSSKSPGWLDEGLAQLIEGEPVPELSIALNSWLQEHSPLRLAKLESGFTEFENEKVAIAYAQSLFMTNLLVKKHGYPAIRDYLEQLSTGINSELAFELAFKQQQANFELEMREKLKAWGLS